VAHEDPPTVFCHRQPYRHLMAVRKDDGPREVGDPVDRHPGVPADESSPTRKRAIHVKGYGYGGDVADMAVALEVLERDAAARVRPEKLLGVAARPLDADERRYGAQHRGDARPHEVQLVDRTGLGGRVGAPSLR